MLQKVKIKRTNYVKCDADIRSEGSDMNGICVGATFGKNGIDFLITDEDNVEDYIQSFSDLKNNKQFFNVVLIDNDPYSMTNFEFVDALLKYENYIKQNNLNPNKMNIDVNASLAGGFECSFKDFDITNGFMYVDVICIDEDFE